MPNHIAPKTLIIFFAFLIFTVVSGSLLCALWYSHLNLRGVLDTGLATDALLEEKYVDEANRFWFIYRFSTITDDIYESKIEVKQVIYEDYPVGGLLAMHYEPKNPHYNVLDILQEDMQRDFWLMMQLSSFVVLTSAVMAFGWLRTIPLERIPRFWQGK